MAADPKKQAEEEVAMGTDHLVAPDDPRKTVPEGEPDDILREKEDTDDKHVPRPDDYTGGPDKPTA